MDMKRSAFTIVELAIAMSVVGLILAVALPRFVSFSRAQDFAVQAGQITGCIQQAQQAAAASTDTESVRFTSATVRSVGSAVTCEYDEYPSVTPDKQPLTDQTLLQYQTQAILGGVQRASTTASGGKILTIEGQEVGSMGGVVRIFFGTAERGIPVLRCSSVVGAALSGGCTSPKKSAILGGGFSTVFEVEDTDSSKTIKGRITVSPLGNPISYEAL